MSRSLASSIDPLDSRNQDEYATPLDYNPADRLTGGQATARAINNDIPPDVHEESSQQSPHYPESSENVVNANAVAKPKKTPAQIAKSTANFGFKMLIVYILIFSVFIGILSIYWGTLYRRDTRYKNMGFLVVSEDLPFEVDGSRLDPFLNDAFLSMIQNNETVINLAKWEQITLSEFQESARAHNNNITAEVYRKVHHQKYWAAVHIKPNASQLIYRSLATANFSLTASGEITELIDVVYESGRQYSALSQYVSKHISQIEDVWLSSYVSQMIYEPIIKSLNDTQRLALLANNNTISILASKPAFNIIDLRPSPSSAVLGPSELGLIYALLFSFHQFNFSLEIYNYIRTKLKFRHYLVWRFVASQINCLVLALVYSLITIAFQVPTNVAFGHSGFVVLWMFMYLYISASGGINENVVTVILAFDQKVFLAPWMIFNIVINISSTFAPFVLMPGFYRYGFALPMYNTYEALKVVFFDTWKGNLGRNLGVLVIWIVVMNIVLVFNVQWANNRARRIATEKKEAEKEKKRLENEAKEKEQLASDTSKDSKSSTD